MREQRPRPTPVESLTRTITDWHALLAKIAKLGVPWEESRFAEYLGIAGRLLAAEQSSDRALLLARFRSDERALAALAEGASQFMQLDMASRVWDRLDARVLKRKLDTVLRGTTLPSLKIEADHPRDTLVELVAAPLLGEYGFDTEITDNGADILLRNETYERIVVECKRPSSLGNGFKKIRRQMWKRTKIDADPGSDRRHIGMAIVAIESSLAGPRRLVRAPTEEDVDRKADAYIEHATKLLERHEKGRHPLAPVTQVVFFLMTGVALLDRTNSPTLTLYTFVRRAPVAIVRPVPAALERLLTTGGSNDLLIGFRTP